MSERLSAEELTELQTAHHCGVVAHLNGYDRDCCVYCGESWPCDASKAYSELAELRRKVEAGEALAGDIRKQAGMYRELSKRLMTGEMKRTYGAVANDLDAISNAYRATATGEGG